MPTEKDKNNKVFRNATPQHNPRNNNVQSTLCAYMLECAIMCRIRADMCKFFPLMCVLNFATGTFYSRVICILL